MEVTFFKDQDEFRKWLEENHQKERELFAGFYKKGSGKPSMTWPESVDQALCFGWIDGIRKSIDGESYCIRFTPRNPSSTWSALNVKKAKALIERGQMKPSGHALFTIRKEAQPEIFNDENKPVGLTADLEEKFRSNRAAWSYFSAQPASYRKILYLWILTAKKKETQVARLEKVIKESEQKKRLI